MKVLVALLVGFALAIGAILWAKQSGKAPIRIGKAVQVQPSLDAGLAGVGGGAVAPDGSVWLWGVSANGVTPKYEERFVARKSPGISDVREISIGGCFILALKVDGTVWATGCNTLGELGTVIKDGRGLIHEWVKVDDLNEVKQVVANGLTALALKKDGTVWAWGSNDKGLLRPGFEGFWSAKPQQIPGMKDIIAIASGGGHGTASDAYFALKESGVLMAWGRRYLLNQPYVAGAPEEVGADEPVRIGEPTNVAKIAINRSSAVESVALRDDGSVVVWGDLASSCDREIKLPLDLPEMGGAVSIAKGTIDVFAVKRDGSFWRWGLVDDEKGRGVCMARPEQWLPPGSAVQVVASGLSNMLLMTDGTVWSWGLNIPLTRSTKDLHVPFDERKQIIGLPPLKQN